jgi:AAHS family 4-hydroxybenzoate transporter-like MFS transporter
MSTPAAAPTDDIVHESKLTPMQWLIMAICFVAYVLDGFDVAVISFAAPAISAEWGVPAGQLGMVFSSGVLGMTLGAMFLASLADLYGRRLMVCLMLLMAGIATVGVAYTQSVTQLIVLRFIAGLGLGALMAALAPLVGEYSPRRHRTLILAAIFSAGPLGPVIGGLIAAPMISEKGWQSIFLYAGLLTIAVGVLQYVVVPESMAFIIKRRPEGALDRVNRILRYIGQDPINHLPPVSGGEREESASVVSLLTANRRAGTLLVWLTFFLAFATVYFFTSWLPQILVNAGWPQDQAIRGAVTMAFGSVIGTTLIGGLAKVKPLNRIICVSFIIGGVTAAALGTMLLAAETVPPVIVWISLLLIGITVMGGFTNLYTVALTIYPAQVRSTGLGWAAGLGRGGAVLSPAIAGLLIAAGVSMPALSLYFALPIFVAAACALWLSMREMA